MKSGPEAKLKILTGSNLPQSNINPFSRTAAQNLCFVWDYEMPPNLRIWHQMILQLLRDEGVAHFPVKGRFIIGRGSIFREGQTLPNYVGYVKKARFY